MQMPMLQQMGKRPFTFVALGVFVAIAVMHLLRLTMDWHVTINNADVPAWISAMAALVAAGLAWMLWRESRA